MEELFDTPTQFSWEEEHFVSDKKEETNDGE